jgi:hypothetical protein
LDRLPTDAHECGDLAERVLTVPVEAPRKLQHEPLLLGEAGEYLNYLVSCELDVFGRWIGCLVAVAVA